MKAPAIPWQQQTSHFLSFDATLSGLLVRISTAHFIIARGPTMDIKNGQSLGNLSGHKRRGNTLVHGEGDGHCDRGLDKQTPSPEKILSLMCGLGTQMPPQTGTGHHQTYISSHIPPPPKTTMTTKNNIQGPSSFFAPSSRCSKRIYLSTVNGVVEDEEEDSEMYTGRW